MRADLRSARVHAAFTAEAGEVLAVVGPNGAGKTSLLRALAGLLPATGSLELAGRDVAGLPPYRRGVGWVPQDGLLFGHLSALDNVAYGLRCHGSRRPQARQAAQQALERLGVGHLAGRRPRELSGGEAARVALARALAPDPELVLLDEPLASLDASTRDEVRRLLRAELSGGRASALVVTHDPVDVVSLADRVLVLEGGAVVQNATPAELVRAPLSTWTATLLGQNAWRGTTDEMGVQVDGGGHVSAAEPLPAGVAALALAEPSAVTLHRREPEGSARNVLVGEVGEVRALGGRVRVLVRATPPVVAEVTVAAAADLELGAGGPVFATIKATEVRLVRV